MLICPNCKSKIDDDSWFCDQCGQELQFCPQCRRPGRGRFCTFDSKELVKASNLFKDGAPVASVPPPEQASIRTTQAKGPILQVDSPTVGLHLINRNLNLDIVIQKGDVIGRTEGRFADVFSPFKKISRQHCKFTFDPQVGWMVTDLGSTNGTKYNNQVLEPHKPQVLKDKSFLVIGNIEFYIEIKDHKQDKTERV